MTGNCGGQDCPAESYFFLRTYVRRKGGWRLLTCVQSRDMGGSRPRPNAPYPSESL